MVAAPTAKVASAFAGYHAIRVATVEGGSNTNPLWLSDISDTNLRQALQMSLSNADYLAPQGAEGAYLVSARIEGLDRPIGGLDPVLVFAPVDWSVTVKIHYTVRPTGGGAPVFDQLIAETGTASGVSALTTDGRVRKAVEAAVSANINDFLASMRTALR